MSTRNCASSNGVQNIDCSKDKRKCEINIFKTTLIPVMPNILEIDILCGNKLQKFDDLQGLKIV